MPFHDYLAPRTRDKPPTISVPCFFLMRKPFSERVLYQFLFILYVLNFLCFVFVVEKGKENRDENGTNSQQLHEETGAVNSNRGRVSMKEVNAKVFRAFGYELVALTHPVPTLRLLSQPTCKQTFSDWRKMAKKPQPEMPPKEIPVGVGRGFLLNNYAALQYEYSNDKNLTRNETSSENWSKLSELMSWSPQQLADLGGDTDGVSLSNAFKRYQLNGKRGFVIGGAEPWIEVLALQNGATSLLTVLPSIPAIPTDLQDRIESIQPNELATTWKNDTFDFAAAFSSIEHSGLGRFGDPIDMIGDIREVRKIRCLLKPGGLLFFGAPIGEDKVVFNMRRMYGPIRLAMLIQGFELIAAFRDSNPDQLDLTDVTEIFTNRKITLVLRKS